MDFLASGGHRYSQDEEKITSSEIEILQYRDEKTPLRIKLLNGEEIMGMALWYDGRALHVASNNRAITIPMSAIAYYAADKEWT